MRQLSFIAALAGALAAAVPAAAILPGPDITAAFPADESQVQAPIREIRLMFNSPVDLVRLFVITPDQRRIVLHDAADGGTERKGTSFTLVLPQPASMPGTYLFEISASITDYANNSAGT
jgi:hypothetical protein